MKIDARFAKVRRKKNTLTGADPGRDFTLLLRLENKRNRQSEGSGLPFPRKLGNPPHQRGEAPASWRSMP